MFSKILILLPLLLKVAQASPEDIHRNVEEPLDVTGNLFSVDFMSQDQDYSSKVNMSINPGCSINNCTLISGIQVSIINVTVQDDPVQDEEQHWLWSVIGRPTVQTAITPTNDTATIKWSAIFDKSDPGKSIKYTKEPFYSGAVMLMNLIEFDDPNDDLDPSKSPSEPIIYPIVNFKWNREVLEMSDERIAVRFMGTNYTSVLNDTSIKGSINLTLSAYSNEGFGHWLPHLSHSSETSQVDIQLQKLESISGFNCSRFALEIYVVSESEGSNSVIRQKSTTLDDEHTPGIFKTEELVLPGWQKNSTRYQSYLQWRPVVYTTNERDLSESTGVNVSSSVQIEKIDENLRKSLLYVLYGEDLNFLLVRKVNVTFGAAEDGYYKKTKYHAWTFTFGVGDPIRNGLSPVIVLAITAMMGSLVIVFITAGIVCVVKKWKKRSEQQPNYEQM